MAGFTDPSDADGEFDELRRRAYGRDSDIGVDPTAIARLRELEAAHRAHSRRGTDAPAIDGAAGTDVGETPTSTDTASSRDQTPEPTGSGAAAPPTQQGPLRSLVDQAMSRPLVQRATATRRSRLAWSTGALVVAAPLSSERR